MIKSCHGMSVEEDGEEKLPENVWKRNKEVFFHVSFSSISPPKFELEICSWNLSSQYTATSSCMLLQETQEKKLS